jgi:hypothetical protein
MATAEYFSSQKFRTKPVGEAELLEVVTKEQLNRYSANLISILRNHMAVRA